jgi:hypothetical protein
MMKRRFPFLKCMSLVINDTTASIWRFIRYIEVCILLHNVLIPFQEEEDYSIFNDDTFLTEVPYVKMIGFNSHRPCQ